MKTWEDLHSVMANYSVKGYAKVYASPEDLDLWSAGITERPLPGSMVGPTFACLIGKQFHNFRFGDRLVSAVRVRCVITVGCVGVNLLCQIVCR